MRIAAGFFGMLGCIVAIVATCLADSLPENIAAGRPYWFSRLPVNDWCQDDGDCVQLTDGQMTLDSAQPYIWVRKGTVGWKGRKAPEIVVDLGSRRAISGFGYNLGAGTSGVTWPFGVDVYVADTTNAWRYVGDVYARSCARTGAPDPAAYYSVYHAVDLNMPACGRYVMFRPLINGRGFVDEVQVFRGSNELLGKLPSGPVVTDFDEHARKKFVTQKVLNDLERVRSRAATLSTEARSDFDREAAAVLVLAERLPTSEAVAAMEARLPLNATHEAVWSLNARFLRAAGYCTPFFWTNNRWNNLDPLAIPATPAREPVVVEMMRGETRSATVNVANPTEVPLRCELRLNGFPESVHVQCAEVVFNDSKDLHTTASAIRPSTGTGVDFVIPAGVSKQVWISFVKPSGNAGSYEGSIVARVGGLDPISLGLKLVLHGLDFPKVHRLHVYGWDFEDGARSSYNGKIKIGDNRKANLSVLEGMLQDTPMARHFLLPKNAKFSESGALLNPDKLDMRAFDEWTGRFPWARQFFLCAMVGDEFFGEKMGTERFNCMVGDYYAAWAGLIRQRGIDPNRFVVNLVDEVRNAASDRKFVTWAKAIRAKTDAFRLFSNPIWDDPSKGSPESFELADILCPKTTMFRPHPQHMKYYRDWAKKGKELWLYSCSGPSHNLDPFAYYRAQAWRAFYLGACGSGFWAFGCGGQISNSWRTYWQPRDEYSPYYVSPDDAWPSKHSEAIMESVEDYEYLCLLRDKIKSIRGNGGDAESLSRALRDGVLRVLKEVEGFDGWGVERDRDVPDRVRLKVLNLLDSESRGTYHGNVRNEK